MSGIQRTNSQRTPPSPERTDSKPPTPSGPPVGRQSTSSQGDSYEMGAIRPKRSPRTYPLPDSPGIGPSQGGLPPLRASSESSRLSGGGLPLPAISSNLDRPGWFGGSLLPLGRNSRDRRTSAEGALPPASPNRSTPTESSAEQDRPLLAQGNATGDRPYEVDRHRMAEEGRNVQDRQFHTQQDQIALQRQQLAWQKAGVITSGVAAATGTTAAIFGGLNYAATLGANKPG